MVTLAGYKNLIPIHNSANSQVDRGQQVDDNEPVILKFLNQDYPTTEQIRRYKQEYYLTCQLKSPGIIKAYSLVEWQRSYVIVLEDFEGISLQEFLKGRKKLSLEKFLFLAIAIVESLGQIHTSHIIHKDINPSNILFNSHTKELKIIDFGISTQLSRENPILKNPNILEGTLAYISPEQTGRMNRSLDYRTDFYSLGITFYEMLTKKLPYPTLDALELIHCHLAKQAISPSQINSSIPLIISEIVMKLMAKNAEDRYQSSWGLKADLENCLEQLELTGKIGVFPLATQDFSERFQIPQKLYGRETEIATLLEAFEVVAETGKVELMMVAGYSGIGKSSLVQELYKPITASRGYFISGKFDQFQRNIPYSAIVSAFTGLIRQLLGETETGLQLWREKLLKALGSNGQIIIDVIPEVELIIGKQLPVPVLGLNESQNRFNLVISNFIRAFCSEEHPLTLFLDDLQWADLATLKLMERMLVEGQTKYLLLLGAYRDNEVSVSHPLAMSLEKLRKNNNAINQITLNPLSLDRIAELIADTLQQTHKINDLANLILEKTGGNPFFTKEFIQALHNEGLLQLDRQSRSWQWDMVEIEGRELTDNVVELMVKKLQQLPVFSQEILSIAACLGAEFELILLTWIAEKSPQDIFASLKNPLDFGLISPTSELDENLLIQSYKFNHDRIQQAAYSLIDDRQKQEFSLQIGRLLLTNLDPQEQMERIFEIVDRLNAGRELITDELERLELVKLNLSAGKKGKDATAYVAAREYLKVGMEELEKATENPWLTEYKLTFALYKELSLLEYLNNNLDASEELLKYALTEVTSNLEQAEIYNLLIVQHTMTAQYLEGIESGQKALALFDINLSLTDLEKALAVEVELVKQNLGDREIASLLDDPEIQIPEQRMVGQTLVNLDPLSYFFDHKFYSVVVLKMVNLSLTYGNIAESAKGYAGYGILLSSVFRDYKLAYEFSCLAVNLSDRFNSQSQKCSSRICLAGHVNHWVNHLKSSKEVFDDGYHLGLSSGELRYSGYALEHSCRYMFYQGVNIQEILELLPKYLEFLQQTNNQWATDGMLGFQLALYNLVGMTSSH
ncbi:MAG: serine/threonine-protein kinase PknK, partial [Okeania sp. SIO1H6]|nr:serine/threonine-protein kinase PknK [Okeania sp. SIO1H6]